MGETRMRAGLVVEGEIRSGDNLRLAADVTGAVRTSQELWLEAGARVEGEVEAKTAKISGQLTGSLSALEGVWLESGGEVEGLLRSPRLRLEDGANLRGRVDIGNASTTRIPADWAKGGGRDGS